MIDPPNRLGLDCKDNEVVRALKAGDGAVFETLVDGWSGMMLRLALAHVDSRSVAEEVVQEAWLTVIRSLDHFEGRSALRTWVLGIVVNVARSRARKERRARAVDVDGPSVDPARFLPAHHPRWPHHWASEPSRWRTPEDELLAGEARHVVQEAIDTLPALQRHVIALRDLEQLPSGEVCHILGITDTHQRVLLHRARSRVRAALERYLAATERT